MGLRFRLGLITGGALIILAIFTFPLWQPVLVNESVQIAFEGLPDELQDDFLRLPQAQQRALEQMRSTSDAMAVNSAAALLATDVRAEETMEAIRPAVVTSGKFITIDVIHSASGTATIYRLIDDSLILRLEDFRATKGPDLHVLLSRHEAPLLPIHLGADYRDLGPLKGTLGDQNYSIPSDVVIANFNSVVIYSLEFEVVYSTASF